MDGTQQDYCGHIAQASSDRTTMASIDGRHPSAHNSPEDVMACPVWFDSHTVGNNVNKIKKACMAVFTYCILHSRRNLGGARQLSSEHYKALDILNCPKKCVLALSTTPGNCSVAQRKRVGLITQRS